MIYRIDIDEYVWNLDKFKKKFLKLILTFSKLSGEKKIVIYTLRQNNEIINFIINELIFILSKLDKTLKQNNIYIKILNVPYCLINNEKILYKFFVNPVFKYFDDILLKSTECYKCKYYVMCLWMKNKKLKPNLRYLDDKLVSKQDYLEKLLAVVNFFQKIGIKSNNISFDIKHKSWKFDYISSSIINRMIININSDFISYDKYFLDVLNFREKHRANLEFKNYILNKKFNKLLKNLDISSYIRYVWFWNWKPREIFYKTVILYWNEALGNKTKKNLLKYIMLDFPVNNILKVWDLSKWNVNIPTRIIKILKPINLENIWRIKNSFDDYIVLFNDWNLNMHIPHIYNFKYFLTYNDELVSSQTSHFNIIFKEMKKICIYKISPDYFFNIQENDILEIDFNNWIVKKIW